MKHRVLVATLAVSLLVLPIVWIAATPVESAEPGPPKASRVILFAADGMRPDLVERFAAEGG